MLIAVHVGFSTWCLILGLSSHFSFEEIRSFAILASLIVSHQQIHQINMQKLVDIAIEKGVRDRFLFIAGGSHLDHELALECGLDSGFGPGTRGEHVAQFIASRLLSPTQEIDGNS